MQQKSLEDAVPDSDLFDLGKNTGELIEWKVLTQIK